MFNEFAYKNTIKFRYLEVFSELFIKTKQNREKVCIKAFFFAILVRA